MRPDLANDEGYLATERAFEAIGLELELNNLTAMPYEEQFWATFDAQFELTEIEMRKVMPNLISSPANLMMLDIFQA